MRKFLAIAALAAVLSTAGACLAHADMGHLDGDQKKGDWFIGFWDLNAPVAARYMLTDDWEIGAGFGFNKPEEGDTGTAFAFMVTRRLIHASRAHLGIRPTLFIESNNPNDLFAIGADLVAEVEIASAVSLVASHGLEYISEDNGLDDSSTIQTRLSTGSRVGFWVELP